MYGKTNISACIVYQRHALNMATLYIITIMEIEEEFVWTFVGEVVVEMVGFFVGEVVGGFVGVFVGSFSQIG